MLLQLIKKEILEHLMSLRFAIACVLCLIVILSSLFVRCKDYTQVLDDYTQESSMEKTRLSTMERPWNFAWEGLTVHRTPNPLKIFIRGIEDTSGGAVQVTSYERPRPIIQGLQNTSVPLFPSIDLVTFVGLIMSLMALVFGYDAICGEKERGTLRLMLSYSVPRHQVLLSKWIGGYVTLIVPFLLTVIIGAMIVMLQKDVSLQGGQWGRFLAIIGLAMVYVAGIYSLSICVSCLTSRPSTSVMLLLSVWVIFVLGIPNLSPYIARGLQPAANAQEVASARRTAAKQTWDAHDEKMKAYRKAHGIPDRWWEKINWNYWKEVEPMYHMWIYELPRRRKNCLHVLNEYKKIDQRYGRELNAQTELTRWVGRVSPFSCFALAATELADAGTMQNSRYMNQLRDYQVRLCEYAHDEALSMEKKLLARKGKSPGPWYKHRDNPVPMFRYVPAAAGDYARKVAVDIGILAGVTVLLFMLSYLKFLRYDVR